MLDRLNGGEHACKNVLLWQTKSQVQPVAKADRGEDGVYNEARAFEREAGPKLKACSEKRPGSWPDNYRQLMREIEI